MTTYLYDSLAWSALWLFVGYALGSIERCDLKSRRRK